MQNDTPQDSERTYNFVSNHMQAYVSDQSDEENTRPTNSVDTTTPTKKRVVSSDDGSPPSLYVSQMQETKQPTPKPSKKKTKMGTPEKICALVQETTAARKEVFDRVCNGKRSIPEHLKRNVTAYMNMNWPEKL